MLTRCGYSSNITFRFKGLPFLEYELHRQLINKLRTKGMNSIFHLKVRKLDTGRCKYATDASARNAGLSYSELISCCSERIF